MNRKIICKLWLDGVMLLTLIFLMGFPAGGRKAHVWAGSAMLVLLVLHHVLNIDWHKRLTKGRYTSARRRSLVLMGFLFLTAGALIFSSLSLAHHVYPGGRQLVKSLHMLGAYWGFLFMSFHLGMYWDRIIAMAKKWSFLSPLFAGRLGFLLSAGIALYGVYAFFVLHFPTYLFLQTHFALRLDMPVALIYMGYAAVMGTCVFLTHQLFHRKW